MDKELELELEIGETTVRFGRPWKTFLVKDCDYAPLLPKIEGLKVDVIEEPEQKHMDESVFVAIVIENKTGEDNFRAIFGHLLQKDLRYAMQHLRFLIIDMDSYLRSGTQYPCRAQFYIQKMNLHEIENRLNLVEI